MGVPGSGHARRVANNLGNTCAAADGYIVFRVLAMLGHTLVDGAGDLMRGTGSIRQRRSGYLADTACQRMCVAYYNNQMSYRLRVGNSD
jgi:hypothetical protein